MRNLLITLICSIVISCHHDIEPEVPTEGIVFFKNPSLIELIADYGRVDASAIGYGGVKSVQYKRYELLKKFSEDSLVGLTSHKSPAVKVYAFDALLEKKSRYLLQIFQDHIADTASFEELSGCFGSTNRVNICYFQCVKDFLSNAEKQDYYQRISSCYSVEQWKYLTNDFIGPMRPLDK